mgnify:CR=1 FL=1
MGEEEDRKDIEGRKRTERSSNNKLGKFLQPCTHGSLKERTERIRRRRQRR